MVGNDPEIYPLHFGLRNDDGSKSCQFFLAANVPRSTDRTTPRTSVQLQTEMTHSQNS